MKRPLQVKTGPDGMWISKYFNKSEFLCPCGNCKDFEIDAELLEKLDAMRELHGGPLKVTSGYRCAAYQEQLKLRGYETATGVSQHTLGRAADVTDGVTPGYELEDQARKAGFKAVGVGKNWVHVDLRSDKDRKWSYVK